MTDSAGTPPWRPSLIPARKSGKCSETFPEIPRTQSPAKLFVRACGWLSRWEGYPRALEEDLWTPGDFFESSGSPSGNFFGCQSRWADQAGNLFFSILVLSAKGFCSSGVADSA